MTRSFSFFEFFVTPFLCSSAFQHGWFGNRDKLETQRLEEQREKLEQRVLL